MVATKGTEISATEGTTITKVSSFVIVVSFVADRFVLFVVPVRLSEGARPRGS